MNKYEVLKCCLGRAIESGMIESVIFKDGAVIGAEDLLTQHRPGAVGGGR